MIPTFPDFKCLERSDKKDTEQFTAGFPPYSDFNFTSLYSWDTESKVRISQLYGNLIVMFADYITGKPFLSFIGNNKVPETADALIEYSQQYLHESVLRLIPEMVAHALCGATFSISEDRDAFDYIYSVLDLNALNLTPSNKSDGARLTRIFTGIYTNHESVCYPLSEANHDAMRKVYVDWAQSKGVNHLETNEYLAFERLLQANHENIYAQLMFIDSTLKGFQCFEVLSPEYAIAHFFKADVNYRGIYDALMWYTGQTLFEKYIQHYNFEQDLGIQNLRRAKGKYTAHRFLKKCVVEKRFSLPP